MRALRVVAVATTVGLLAVVAFPAFLKLRSMDTKVFEPQPFDFVLLAVSAFAIALGVQVVPWRERRYVAVLALIASGFLLFGFLAAFSIGLPFLPAGLLLLLVLYRALRRAPAGADRLGAALGGAVVGFALPLLYVALIVPATVECLPNGGGTSSGRWTAGSQMVTSTGRVDVNGDSSGRIEFGDSVVTYRCQGGRVAEFERAPK